MHCILNSSSRSGRSSAMDKSALASFAKSLRYGDTMVEDSFQFTELQESNTSLQDSPDIPDVNERLAYLKPSRQLLEFYRKRFAEQDCEYDTLVHLLKNYKAIYTKQNETEWSMRQREEEMAELQKALSEIQVSLFQEREQVLRLYAENDRYKIHDLSSRRIIKKLLEEGGHRVNDDADSSPPEIRQSGSPTSICKVSASKGYKLVVNCQPPGEDDRVARESLLTQVQVLQERLEARTREYKELVEATLEERLRLCNQYYHVSDRDMDKVKTATQKLYKTQELLYLSTEDLLTLKQESKSQERQWMVQKDRLLRELDAVKEQLNIDQPCKTKKVVLNVSNNASDGSRRQALELKKLKEDVVTAQQLQQAYREQVLSLEDELARLREQDDLKNDDFNDKVGKIGQRYQIMKKRFEDLEKKRNLEVEGFKNDIKALRIRLKEMQQQVFKVTLSRADSLLDESRPPYIDLAVLKNIRSTAKHTTKLSRELKDLKLRIHKMEAVD